MTDNSTRSFSEWPLDLLVDYVLKIHHRNIRLEGPKTLAMISALKEKVAVMDDVERHFSQSLDDLDNHFFKEENVLFPYVGDLFEASRRGQRISPMHCGTVANPIGVMMMEHQDEQERHRRIVDLTCGYKAPAGASPGYVEVLDRLRRFAEDLDEHIHIENDIIFPRAEQLEKEWVDGCVF